MKCETNNQTQDKQKVSRKRLTSQQITKSLKFKKNRTKIANMVARKPEIQKHCCICGNTDAQILHNENNPFMISFICKKCRANKRRLEEAETKRVDIRETMDKSKISSGTFLEIDVKLIVENYLLETLSIGRYCTCIGISRYIFNKLIERYSEIFNEPTIKRYIQKHSNKLSAMQLSLLALERKKSKH